LFSGCDPEANPANNTGFVTIYERSGSSWSPVADLQASNADSGDRFGNSVAFNSDAGRLAVGATRENSLSRGLNGPDGNDLFGKGSGAAYLFERDAVSSNVWAQTQYLKASNTGLTDEFGSAVALSSSGESLVVGAWGEASPFPGINRSQEFNNAPGSGAIYVFREDTASLSWSQLAFVKAPGVRPGMGFGWDVELVQDGSVLVGAAPAFKTFGSVPGSVFIY